MVDKIISDFPNAALADDSLIELENAAGNSRHSTGAQLKQFISAKGSDIASATTTDIGAATGDFVDVTGTTTITGLGTIAAGIERTVRFTGVLILTHNATSLILPTGANITTAAGDIAMFRSLGSGNWVCVGYLRANGEALVGGGGGDAWSIVFKPNDNEPPTTNFATLDTRNNHPVLDFDTTTQEAAIFSGVLPHAYAGAGITVSLYWAATSAITGTIGWDVAIERMDASSLDIDADSFATAQTVTAATVPGTSGQLLVTSVNISDGANMDSLAAGEAFRIRVRRDVANDDAAGDAELLRVVIKEQ